MTTPAPRPRALDPLDSVEVRWFGRGEVPALLASWFGHGPGLPDTQPPRVDHYLRRTEPGLGVKRRGDFVEVKQRLGSYGILALGRGAVGRVERWRKWSFPLAAPDQIPTGWLAVRKERLLRRFTLADGANLLPLPPATPATTACDWELTRLELDDPAASWWTVGFEAFGEPTGLRRLLLQVADLLLANGEPPDLPADLSLSYPAWLLQNAAAPTPPAAP